MAHVKLQNVWKRYGEVEAVKDLTIDCKDREFLCLLGPSGCGKSSTLRMIAGLEYISAGQILIDNVVVNDVDPHRRDIAMVFESYALYPHKKVFDNMAYPLRVQKKPEETIKQKVHHASKILDIMPLLDRWPRQLSGGQKQRVAIGRAIVRNPKVFLLDEPISHLDAKLRTHMRGELKRLHRDLDATMIYVTHDQLEAMSMADRIAVLNFGELQQLGTPDEVFNHPANKFVGGFLGDPPMNFIQCTLRNGNGSYQIVHDQFDFKLPESVSTHFVKKDLGNERPVELGIRPESFELFQKEPSKFDIAGKIYITEPLGEDVIIDITIGEDMVKAKIPVGGGYEIDEPIWLKIKFEHIHIFDGESGRSLLA
jgi:multiple sugar transport system ATP-binding protein